MRVITTVWKRRNSRERGFFGTHHYYRFADFSLFPRKRVLCGVFFTFFYPSISGTLHNTASLPVLHLITEIHQLSQFFAKLRDEDTLASETCEQGNESNSPQNQFNKSILTPSSAVSSTNLGSILVFASCVLHRSLA